MPALSAYGVSEDLLLSRHQSWLELSSSLHDLAFDADRPLAGRLRFLALAAENLDGFFMKRLDALAKEVAAGVSSQPPWPPATAAELAEVMTSAAEQTQAQERLWTNDLRGALAAAGLVVSTWADLGAADHEWLEAYFLDWVFPILTPLAVDPGRPFPYLSQLSLSLAVVLSDHEGEPLFARVKVPTNQSRWVRLPSGVVVALEEVIAAQMGHLFPGMTIHGTYPFRVTRSVDVASDEDRAGDLRDFAQDLLRGRRFAPIVRVEVDRAMPAPTRALLAHELNVAADTFIDCDGPLALVDLARLPGAEVLGDPLLLPAGQPHPALHAEGPPEALFAAIRAGDVLVHHPYQDYRQTVAAFVRAAARDPAVRAIKQSLYRTSAESDSLEALIAAAGAGKEVAVLLELQARLDEAASIAWAQRLSDAGIHVSYGFVGFKTHTRLTLVVREEPDGLRTYVHFGTGDYNLTTAATYTDVSLFSARPALGEDIGDLFNWMTGASYAGNFHELVLAPQEMRETLLELIAAETAEARAGRQGCVTAMVNAVADVPILGALVEASQAGVQVDLVVRRECGLLPGIPEFTDNIRIRRVLGDYLEHQRVFRFGAGDRERVYISSADWQSRNLDHRIEAMIPVVEAQGRAQLSEVLDLYLADTAAAWALEADGSWTRVEPADGEPAFSAQAALAARYKQAVAAESPGGD